MNTENIIKAAVLLAAGLTQTAVTRLLGVDDRTVRRWLTEDDFAMQVQAISAWQDTASTTH